MLQGPMNTDMAIDRKILVVVRWPLGGIRAYMRYMFRHFPHDYKLTVLAASTREDNVLLEDVREYGATLRLIQISGMRSFAIQIFKELKKGNYDLILSQGFMSAVAVYPANLAYRIPHVLTVHGVVEERLISGHFRSIKKFMLGRILSQLTVLYGVSNDILRHVYQKFPHVEQKTRSIVIPNGIDPDNLKLLPEASIQIRESLAIEPGIFLFGFFSRFMPQKGFDLLIDAVALLREKQLSKKFAVIAAGSGDYIREYRLAIKKKGLDSSFHFFPFQPIVHNLFPQVDAIVMPSRWEASGLLAMESLCLGIPLIASDCIGLRETIKDTPTHVFSSESLDGLINVMEMCLRDNNFEAFHEYTPIARQRYDVRNSATELVNYIDKLLDNE